MDCVQAAPEFADAFGALLGARRGSPTAQAARDAAERSADADADADAFLRRALAGVGGHVRLRALLLDGYRTGAQHPGHPGHAQLVARAAASCSYDELLAVVFAGDPDTHPGLTGSALEAAELINTLPSRARHREQRLAVLATVLDARLLRSELAAQLSGGGHCDAELARLSAACQRLAEPIRSQRPRRGRRIGGALERAALRALAQASPSMRAGPLSSWESALRERARAGHLSAQGVATLRNLFDEPPHA